MAAAPESRTASAGAEQRSVRRCFKGVQTGCLFCCFLVAGLAAADWLFPLPALETAPSTVVTADDGSLLRCFPDPEGIWRYPIRIDQVSPLYLEALIGYEDRYFYHHPGVNPFALVRALVQNLSGNRIVSGGSTLTMQAARLLDPHQRTAFGKLKQVFRALQLEWRYSKQDILTWYFNHAPFGGTIEGVEAASRTYLGKSAHILTHAEAALLAVLPQAPSRYRPDRHPVAAQAARDKVLDRLVQTGCWTRAMAVDAKKEVVPSLPIAVPFHAPLLARRLHQAHPRSPDIQTTLDSGLQYRVAQLAAQYARRLPEKSSVGILVVNHQTGACRAYAGSAAFLDAHRFGHVDMVTAVRSPGSTLKPFLYALAMDAGLIHSASLLSDAPRIHTDYRPGNFSGGFHGPVTVTRALRDSLNLPAVQVLEAFGPVAFADRLRHSGVDLVFPGTASSNLSMILGGVGASLQSLVTGYTALANQGITVSPVFIRGAVSRKRYLFSSGASWIVHDMLKRPFPGDEGIGAINPLRHFAWKTGTSFGFRDAWAIAVGHAHVIGVWVGRPDGTPVPGYYGAEAAIPLLRHTLFAVGERPLRLQKPASVGRTDICWPTGTRADANTVDSGLCHMKKKAWILDGCIPPTLPDPLSPTQSGEHVIWVESDTGLRVDRHCLPAAFEKRTLAFWPTRVEPFIARHLRRSAQLPPPSPSCTHAPALAGEGVRILGMADATTVTRAGAEGTDPEIRLEALGGATRLYWFLNGAPVAELPPGQIGYLRLPGPGNYQLLVMDATGHSDLITFSCIDDAG